MRMKKIFFPVLISTISLLIVIWAECAVPGTIGIEEKPGQQVPLNAMFSDEKGNRVALGKIIQRPTIVSLVYLRCTHNCPLLLWGLADALGKIDLSPSRDYSLITISFDDKDTPEVAREKKRNYIKAVGKPFPETSWNFLTGDGETINKFTEAVGFRFSRENNGFSHPRGLIVLSPTGRVVRYLYGTTFFPFDIKMALTEASQEKKTGYASLLLYCFGYDHGEKKYVFNISKVFLTVLFFLVVYLGTFLIATSSRISRRRT